MHTNHNKETSGFTLIELMIVVAIIGVLAVVSIPLFQDYIKDSKKAEGREKLSAIGKGAIIYFHKEHFYSVDATDKRKSLYPDDREEMHPPQNVLAFLRREDKETSSKSIIHEDDLNREPWIRLGFTPTGTMYYEFIYRTTEDSRKFTACSVGNLIIPNDSRFVIQGDENGRLSSIFDFDGTDTDEDGTADSYGYEGSDEDIKNILDESFPSF